MYIKGIKDYDRNGNERETGLYAGPVSQDGELRTTGTGKQYGTASVRAFNRQDGSPVFMALKSFSGDIAYRIAGLHKHDRILAAGTVESREYNGKQYTDMMVDYLQVISDTPASNLADLEGRMGAAGFGELSGEDEELPF